MATYKGEEIDLTPTAAMAEEGQRFKDWRAEGEKGGTDVAVARATQLVNRQELSPETVRRMHSFFSRHEVDKEAEGFSPGEDGYPSPGRVAWAAWGGDPGQSWARGKVATLDRIDERGADMADMEQRHVVEVVEDDESVNIKFKKHHEEMAEEVVAEERFDRAEMQMRAFDMNGEKVIDEETRTVRVGVSSEQPVKRDFGMEVMDHRAGSMNLEFLNSGRAPLLLDHDMERQIGVVESVELDEDARRLRAVVRFGKGAMASEVFTDVVDGIRQNISVGYRIDSRVEQEDDPEDYYRVSTTPMEISIVSIPADQSSLVGVGRSNPETLSATVKTEGKSEMSDINLDEVRAEAAADAAKTVQRNAKDIMVLARDRKSVV